MSDELAEKIVAFVDREAGLDAPLTVADETVVRDLLEHDPAVQSLVRELRATNAGLDTLLDDVASVEVPDKLVALIRGHGADDVLIADKPERPLGLRDAKLDADGAGRRPPADKGSGYGALAAAASIAFFVSSGALLYLYTTYQDDRQRLETALAAASTSSIERQKELALVSAELERNQQATRQLTGSEDALQQLQSGQAALQRQYDELLVENERLNDLAEGRATSVAALPKEREQIIADLSSIREALEAERIEFGQARGLVRAEDGDLTAELADRQQRLAELSEALETTLQQATVQENTGPEAELASSQNWLDQIAHYHRIYGATSRRHLVEVGADEQAYIEQWLSEMLRRPIPVPDLSSFGITFQGARLLGIEEKPLAQLVYLDAEDRPLALCIIPTTEGVKAPAFSNNQDLSLVDWRDGRLGFAVVGSLDHAHLASISRAILSTYDL